MSEPLTQAERAELVAEVTRQHEQSAFARKHMDLTDNSLLRYEATVAALTAENERLKAVAEEVRTVRYTLMYVSSLLCEPVTDKNIRNARKAMEPLYYDALRDVKAERAALPSSRETTDGRTDPS